MVVLCSFLVEVVVHGGKVTQGGNSWGEKVITSYFIYIYFNNFIKGIFVIMENIDIFW
jgi:hypothetical protein